jgi:hypothetical protein
LLCLTETEQALQAEGQEPLDGARDRQAEAWEEAAAEAGWAVIVRAPVPEEIAFARNAEPECLINRGLLVL